MHEAMTSWQQFGLVGLLSGSGTLLLFFVVKWTLSTTKEILAQAADERKVFSELQKSWVETIAEHNARARAITDAIQNTADFQRKEHQDMITKLGAIDERTKTCLTK